VKINRLFFVRGLRSNRFLEKGQEEERNT